MMVARGEKDVLREWTARGWITDKSDSRRAASYIRQAKDYILDRCNIPVMANVPDGLFYAWVDIAYRAMNAVEAQNSEQVAGVVKSITDGDTTVHYGAPSGSVSMSNLDSAAADYAALIYRYRRMA